MVTIFTYQRLEFLKSLLSELKGESIVVIDDQSDYPVSEITGCDYYRFPHQGKEGFFRLWNEAFKLCKQSKDEWFLFLPDDVQNVQLDEIKRITSTLKGKWAFNVLNVGADRGWTLLGWTPTEIAGVDCFKMGYVDGAFACSRETLEALEFRVDPVSPLRAYESSGVGLQLSQRLVNLNIPIYITKSLCYHGDHESKMHKDLRKREPLVNAL